MKIATKTSSRSYKVPIVVEGGELLGGRRVNAYSSLRKLATKSNT